MLKLEDFKEYKVKSSVIKGGTSTHFGFTYECDGSDDAFSIMSTDIYFAYATNRCGGSFTVTPLYD